MNPGRKKVAGETLPVALTPPQPEARKAMATPATAMAKRTERALFMPPSIREGSDCRNSQVGGVASTCSPGLAQASGMALPVLTDEQVRARTRSEKDRWWRDHVYRGDMRPLTLRTALAGFVLGGVLAATSLYIGAKMGLSIGVGLTSVLVTFGMFRWLGRTRWGGGFTILENSCTQSITTSAGSLASGSRPVAWWARSSTSSFLPHG